MLRYNKIKLDNGVRLISAPLENTRAFTAMVYIGTGSRYEEKRISGISHFFEHVLFKGTWRYPTANHISEAIDSVGGFQNAFTSKDQTAYYITVPDNHYELALDILSDMIAHPLLDEQEFEREKNVILEEINMYLDTPSSHIGDLFEEVAFGDVPLGWHIIGYPETVLKINRNDLMAYLQKQYVGSNIVVAIAGSVTDDVILKAQNYFSGIVAGNPYQPLPYLGNIASLKRIIHYKKTDQAHLAIGFEAPGRNNESRWVCDVLTAILGAGSSSRLFKEIREKRGVAYYVGANYDDYTETGLVSAFAGLDVKRIDEAISVILKEIARLRDEKVLDK